MTPIALFSASNFSGSKIKIIKLASIVRNVGSAVEKIINSMAAIRSHDRQLLGCCVFADDVAQVAIARSRLNCENCG